MRQHRYLLAYHLGFSDETKWAVGSCYATFNDGKVTQLALEKTAEDLILSSPEPRPIRLVFTSVTRLDDVLPDIV